MKNMKNMKVIEKVELIRALQDLLESDKFSTENKRIIISTIMNIIREL